MTIEQEIRAAALQATVTMQAGLSGVHISMDSADFNNVLDAFYAYIQAGGHPYPDGDG